MEPNFFIVGAAKSGTTSLYRYLSQHPDVYMSPIKEPCFFAPEVADYTHESRRFFESDAAALRAYLDGPLADERTYGIVLDWDDYLKLFKRVGAERAVGEASVSYLTSAAAPHAIRKRVPGARIIAILRNPVDRLFSQYAETFASNHTSLNFDDWIDENLRLEAARNPTFGPIWTGRYSRQLERYFDCFPRDQMRLYLYDDYAREPSQIVRDALEFLGVDPTRAIDFSRKHNVTAIPRSPVVHRRVLKPLMRAAKPLIPTFVTGRARGWWFAGSVPRPSEEQRARTVEIYADDVRAMSQLLGRDLSAWLTPHASR